MRRLGQPRTPRVRTLKPIKELDLEAWLDRWYPDCSQTARDQLEEAITNERQ